MKVYCGTDIIEVERIKKAIEKNDRFKTNIFSKNEIEDIEKSNSKEVKFQRYAGRFASKEAIYKAISKFTVESDYTPKFLDVEIVNDEAFKQRPKGELRDAVQGFVTEDNFFVDRKEALVIAEYFNQIKFKHEPKDELLSEDLI